MGIFALALNTYFLNKIIFVLVSLSVGALFSDALIYLIPEAYSKSESTTIAALWVLGGIFSFFILEKLLSWRHVHNVNNVHEIQTGNKKCCHQIQPLGFLVIVSDSIHNLLDGVIIGASYLVSIEVGIATTVAIIL